MPSLIVPECPCCQKMLKTGDRHHCEWCWNRFHNGLRDKDWLPREQFQKRLAEF